jgi:hypothetical protein
MILYLFVRKMVFVLSVYAIVIPCIGFILIDSYKKKVEDLNVFEAGFTDPSEEVRQLARNHDYVGFAVDRAKSGIPGAIGCGIALSSLDIAAYLKKKKESEDLE